MIGDVTFIKGKGGLGRPLPGTDYISALLFYTNVLPSGFLTTDRIKTVFSVADAKTLGILNTNIGETKATGTITSTGAGVVGDSILIQVFTDLGLVTLGTALVPTSPTTTLNAAAIVASINAGTLTHGFTATNAAAVVTVTAPTGSGIGANTFTFTITVTGTATNSNAAFTGGVFSEMDILAYHISEFFRIQPQGKLYIGIYPTSDSAIFASIPLMQTFANGEIKQMGIYQKTNAFATSQVTTIQSVLNPLEANHMPISSVLYQADWSGTADVTSINTDITALTAKNVTVLLGQDGAGVGGKIWRATKKSIGSLGTSLGAVALAAVNESIRWIAKFDMATSEYDTLAFANGQLYSGVSYGAITNLDTLGYVFLKKEINLVGSWHNKPHTAITASSDYSTIYNNRTIDKAIRSLRTLLLPQLAAPVVPTGTGQLSEDTIAYYTSLGQQALDQMVRDKELAAYAVIINPTQNVLSTGVLTIAILLVPIGVADSIVVNVSYVLSI